MPNAFYSSDTLKIKGGGGGYNCRNLYLYLKALQWSRCSIVGYNVTISFILRVKVSKAAEKDPIGMKLPVQESY